VRNKLRQQPMYSWPGTDASTGFIGCALKTVFFLLPQLPHTINLLIINRVSADKTAKHYRV
jgi:hypothetical protein